MRSTILAEFWAQKSTNGRSADARLSWPRLGFQALGWVAPEAAKRRALEGFLTPPPPRTSPSKAREIPGVSSDRFHVKLETSLGGHPEQTDLEVAVWGRGPAVYLVHGWGGRSSQWSSFLEPITKAGFTAVVFDAPGHGASPAKRSSIPHFSAALAAVVDSVGPAHAIVGHSLGGNATALALARGLAASRVAFIAVPADPTEYFAAYLKDIGLPAHLHDEMWTKFENEYGFASHELPVRPHQGAEPTPALVVHDRDDRDVPYANADRIARAWSGATVMTTTGLGHGRILRDRGVVESVSELVARAHDDR
jgi:pimeloyl-ACP methyl ester carboxylesterase